MCVTFCVRRRLISVSFVSHLVPVFIFPFLRRTVCPHHPDLAFSSQLTYFLSSCLQILLSLKTPWLSRGDLFCSCFFSQLVYVPIGTAKSRITLTCQGGRPSSELGSGAIWRHQSTPWYQCINYQQPLTCLDDLLIYWCSLYHAELMWYTPSIHEGKVYVLWHLKDFLLWQQVLKVWIYHWCRRLPQIQLFPRWL